MNTEIKVSVIIPVYNAEKYLRECLDSVANQTLKNIEIICIDDGSEDRSLEILHEYEQADERFVILTKDHSNAGAARNSGLAIATGTYVMFLDSDDFFESDMLESCYNQLEIDGSDIVVFPAQRYDMKTGKTAVIPWSFRKNFCPAYAPFQPQDMSKYIFNAFQNWPWNKMFRRLFIQENGLTFQEIPRTNDMAFVCLGLVLAKKISTLTKPFVIYRSGTGSSLQSTNDRTPCSFWDACKETKRRLTLAGLYKQYEQSFLNTVLDGANYNLNSVKGEQAYRDIYALLKYYAEDEFGFLKHPADYYYLPNQYSWLSGIINGVYRDKDAEVKEPKVSVIMPSLNVRGYIRESIESVLDQTLREIEIICVDAGSTDGTLEILQEYERLDKRVKLVNSEKKSYGYQINKGFDIASGEYIGIVETDDYVLPKMFETLYDAATKNGVDFVRSDFTRFWGERKNRTFKEVPLTYWNKKYEKFYNQVIDPADDLDVFNLLKNNVTGIYNTAFLRDNNIRLNETPGASFQDNGLWFFTFMYATRIFFLNQSFYMCRRDNPNSSVKDKGKAFIVCNEYDYILSRLKAESGLYGTFIYAYWVGKFGSYQFTYSRISEGLKYPFLLQLVEEFLQAKEENELDEQLFPVHSWKLLSQMLKDPAEYYLGDYKVRAEKNPEQKGIMYAELLEGIEQETAQRLKKRNTQANQPMVSIIIPVYNVGSYLIQCLNSVLTQTLSNIEIICVDDGSTDDSLAILQVYQTKDTRMLVFSQENAGAGIARNFALKQAAGKYIAFMDGDDWYPQETILERLYTTATENNVKICGGSVCSYCDGRMSTDDGDNLLGNVFSENALMSYEEHQFDYSFQRFIYEREFLLENNLSFPLYQRFQAPSFFIRTMIHAKNFYAISDVTYCYRYIPQKIAADKIKLQDLMCGLRDSLELSSAYKLKKLHELTLYRCERDYYSTLIIVPEFHDEKTLSCLLKLNSAIDCDLLGVDEGYIIKPLRELLFNRNKIQKNDCQKRKSNELAVAQTKKLEKIVPKSSNERALRAMVVQLNCEITNIHQSASYRIGRFITFIPRKIRGGIRCYKEHGMRYTLNRVREKFGALLGR